MIRGVIFDMDGVITDTERLFLRFWTQVMEEKGLPVRRDVVAHCVGLDHRAIETYVRAQLGETGIQVMQEAARRCQGYLACRPVPVKPGLDPLLEELERRRIPFAVATSALQSTARPRLEALGLLTRIRGLVTGDMVSTAKPEPEIFLRAAECLELEPESCLVLEDSPHGILAAHRAGCLPVMIPDLCMPDRETQALLFAQVSGLEQVTALLPAGSP